MSEWSSTCDSHYGLFRNLGARWNRKERLNERVSEAKRGSEVSSKSKRARRGRDEGDDAKDEGAISIME